MFYAVFFYQINEQKNYKNTFILSFIFIYVVLFTFFFLSSPSFKLLSSDLLYWRTTFNISYRVGLLEKSSLSFYLSCINFLFIFEGYFCLISNSWLTVFLSVLWICHFTDFWPPWFLIRSQLFILLNITCSWRVTSLFQFSIVSPWF